MFSHWTYAKTNGDLIIVDLQGVRGTKYYTLTDPAIHSFKTGPYGDLDLGQRGIKAFFSTHQCEGVCKGLMAPKVDKNTDYISQSEKIMRLKRKRGSIAPSRAYEY